ncbi:MAG: RNA polymerase sigma-70 factor [Bacteroidetes bacterium]|nr:RNA polymerase sigma-70 factor [Bacteroidota bacterium]
METSEFLDKHAFKLLFKREFGNMCFLAQRYVQDAEEAREIVQDAFLALWEKRITIDPSKNPGAYLATIVRNKSLNWIRDHGKFHQQMLNIEQTRIEKASAQGDPLITSEISHRIETALAELPEKCREVFLLNRHDQMKYQEIADHLNISVKTVETQMSKALQHFRQRLSEFMPVIFIFLYSCHIASLLTTSLTFSLFHHFTISPFHHFTISPSDIRVIIHFCV